MNEEKKILNEQVREFKTVIKHAKNARKNWEGENNFDWEAGWVSAIDFIEENLGWEATDEAKTIVEENKELTERVRELEEENKVLKAIKTGHELQIGIQQNKNKRYHEAMEKAKNELDDFERYGNKCATKAYITICETLENDSQIVFTNDGSEEERYVLQQENRTLKNFKNIDAEHPDNKFF